MVLHVTWLLFSLNFNLFFCQNPNMEGFIVGGQYAKIQDFPHSASLTAKCNLIVGCGASIISQQILLTAAHCLEDCVRQNKKHFIIVRTGKVNKREGQKSTVIDYRLHEYYDAKRVVNDIALMKIKRPLKYGPEVSRVALTRNTPQGRAYVAGWGRTDEYSSRGSDLMKFAMQPLFDRTACKKIINKQREMPNSWFCAGNLENRDYPLLGDSGSALIVKGYIQIGIVSFRNIHFKSVTVYVNVSQYINWIDSLTKKFYCTG